MVNGVVNSRESLVKDQSSKTKDLSARGDILYMNKKRGGSLFFMPYLYSLLYTLYSIPYFLRTHFLRTDFWT